MQSTRRGFLAAMAALFVADPERLLWVPGKKSIFIPPAKKIVSPAFFDEICATTLRELNREVVQDLFFREDLWMKLAVAYSGGTTLASPLVYAE